MRSGQKMFAFCFMVLSVLIGAIDCYTLPEPLYKPDADSDVFYPVVGGEVDGNRDVAVIKAIKHILDINSYTSDDALRVCSNLTGRRKSRESQISNGTDHMAQIQPQVLALLKNENAIDKKELEDKIHQLINNHQNDQKSLGTGIVTGKGDKWSSFDDWPMEGSIKKTNTIKEAPIGPSGDSNEGVSNETVEQTVSEDFKIQEGDVAMIEEQDGDEIQVVVEHGHSHPENDARVSRSDDAGFGFTIVEELTIGDDDDEEISQGVYDGNSENEQEIQTKDGEQAIDLRPDVLDKIIIAQHLAKRSSLKGLAEGNLGNIYPYEHSHNVNVRRKRV